MFHLLGRPRSPRQVSGLRTYRLERQFLLRKGLQPLCDALGIPGPRIPLPRMRNGTEHTSRREQDLPLRPLRTCMDTFQTRFPRQMHLLPELPFRRGEDLHPHLHPMQAHLEERHPLPCQMSLLQFNQMERDQLPSPMQTLRPQMVLPERVQRQGEDLSPL